MNPNDIKDKCPYTNEAMIQWLKGRFLEPLGSIMFTKMTREELFEMYEINIRK